MKIFLTGSSSGLGHTLFNKLTGLGHHVIAPLRSELNLSLPEQICAYKIDNVDMLINCAGTGVGGKIDFCNHRPENVFEIFNTNLIAPVMLCHKVLNQNSHCKIVNITSTNNNRYWPNDLAYSLSKKSLANLGSMLCVEYPGIKYLEVRLGLTKTNFNSNRYANEQERFYDLYQSNNYQTVESAGEKIINVLFDDSIKSIEVSP
jgi:short-subunit dehydrogenase